MKIVFTPDWFLGKDVLIDVFSFLVLLTFFILSSRSYQLNKKKSSFYLGLGFLIIALGQLASVFTKVVLYYDTTIVQSIGQAVITSHLVRSVDIFYDSGFFFYRLLTLSGLFLIYRLSSGKKMLTDILLIFYFIVISAAVSTGASYIFHLTVLLLLIMIISGYYKVYKKNRNVNTKILLIGFSTLALGELICTFSNAGNLVVAADIIELISYIIFLGLIIKILRSTHRENILRGPYGKKKK